MIQYRCDGPDCDVVMGEDDLRITLAVENKPVPEPGPDEQLLVTYIPTIGFTGEHDFHEMACLASWAMSKHLELAHPGEDGLPPDVEG